MVRRDAISTAFTLLAIMISVYLATWQKDFATFFPTILLLSGLGMSYYMGQRIEQDVDLTGDEARDIAFWTLVCLFGIAIGSLVSTNLFTPRTRGMDLVGFDIVLFGILVAVAEETMFRGAVLSFLSQQLPAVVAVVSSASIFMIYHFSVYRSDPAALMYVFTAGFVLSFVTLKTRRLSPAILAHVANNIIAFSIMG